MNRRQFLQGMSATFAASLLTRSLPLAASQTKPAEILKRKIPATGEMIPAIGLGTWQAFMPKDPNDGTALAPLEEVLKTFYDLGGRVVDTAPAYGAAEEVTGKLAEKLGITNDLFFATKVSASGSSAAAQMNASLKKLRRDKIDLMQIHNLADAKNNLALLREWKKEGKFRYIGITHISPAKMDDLTTYVKDGVDFVQLPYSLAMRDAEKSLIPACVEHNVAIIVMRPFDGGNLFAKTKGKPLPDSVKTYASSWGEAYLKWILANEAITAVLPATSKVDHLKDNMNAGSGRLPDAKDRDELAKTLEM
ncbi:MAG: aldo/keto reductase [Anaerolineae bacterium]|nr:aldo/keto reductase [Phycisphaerae bacterium]